MTGQDSSKYLLITVFQEYRSHRFLYFLCYVPSSQMNSLPDFGALYQKRVVCGIRIGMEIFMLMCSDLTLSPQDIIKAYSYRFKIEVSFKVLKHLMGVFFYHFWTSVWPKIGKRVESDLSSVGADSERLIAQTTNAIEGFVNFGCIATGILQIIALNFYSTIWKSYRGWLRTITSVIPTEETARSVIQEEFFHNFRSFNNSAIYRIIMSKNRGRKHYQQVAMT